MAATEDELRCVEAALKSHVYEIVGLQLLMRKALWITLEVELGLKVSVWIGIASSHSN